VGRAVIRIEPVAKNDPELHRLMAVHYTHPKGFVGRQLFFHITWAGTLYGCIAFGSATRYLPGRPTSVADLTHGLNNIFYHIEKQDGRYPCRNFTTRALLLAEPLAIAAYETRYHDAVWWLESLVELPRTGDLYRKAGYREVGITKGYTCRRVGGNVLTEVFDGRRVWNMDPNSLRPKRVFLKDVPHEATPRFDLFDPAPVDWSRPSHSLS